MDSSQLFAMQAGRMGGNIDPQACDIGATSFLHAVLPNFGNAAQSWNAALNQPIALFGINMNGPMLPLNLVGAQSGLDAFGLSKAFKGCFVRDLPPGLTDGMGGGDTGIAAAGPIEAISADSMGGITPTQIAAAPVSSGGPEIG